MMFFGLNIPYGENRLLGLPTLAVSINDSTMRKQKSIPELKGREFNGTYYPKPKRIRQQPRQKIRQLLRSFLPLEPSETRAQIPSEKVT
jgi:hypothetical protein